MFSRQVSAFFDCNKNDHAGWRCTHPSWILLLCPVTIVCCQHVFALLLVLSTLFIIELLEDVHKKPNFKIASQHACFEMLEYLAAAAVITLTGVFMGFSEVPLLLIVAGFTTLMNFLIVLYCLFWAFRAQLFRKPTMPLWNASIIVALLSLTAGIFWH